MTTVCLLAFTTSYSAYEVYNKGGRGLTSVPTNIPSNTNYLYLADNKISHINPPRIRNLDELTRVSLDKNEFTTFPNLCNVGETLQTLSLDENIGLVEYPAERLECLVKLHQLSLNSMEMIALPDLGPVGDTLSILQMSQNQLTVELPWFEFCSDFTTLFWHTLRENNFTAIPDLSQLDSSLPSLIMGSNQITEIPPMTMAGFRRLYKIVFEHNQLSEFPDFCHLNASLVELSLGNNPLGGIREPARLTCLYKLKILDLASTELTEPLDLSPLGPILEEVWLQNNKLTELPVMNNMTLLRIFSVASNPNITYIPDDFFEGWLALSSLNLHGLKVTQVPNLKLVADTLKTLILSNTNIQNIGIQDLALLHQLTELQISELPIMVLPTACSSKGKCE